MVLKRWLMGTANVMLFSMAGLISLEHFGVPLLSSVRERLDEGRQANSILRYWAELSSGDQVLGDPRVEPLLVMFTDYQCPFCRSQEIVLDSLFERMPGVKVVVQHYPLPFHAGARPAAIAATCAARQGRFSVVHRALYEQLRAGDTVDVSSLAIQAEMPAISDFMGCVNDRSVAWRVDSIAAVARELGIRGTPAFLFRGRVHRGVISVEALEAELGVL